MDPLLIIDGVAVGVTAMVAYITALAKKVLKARLVKLEKTRDVLFQRYILVHRHLRALDGTRRLYSGWIVEKRKKLDELAIELQEWEGTGEEEAEGEREMEPAAEEPAVEEGSGNEDEVGNERQEATEENRLGGDGGDPVKPDADSAEGGEEDGKKDINVNFLNQRRAIDFSRRRKE